MSIIQVEAMRLRVSGGFPLAKTEIGLVFQLPLITTVP